MFNEVLFWLNDKCRLYKTQKVNLSTGDLNMPPKFTENSGFPIR